MTPNIQIAIREAARCTAAEELTEHAVKPFGRRADIYVGDDSDFLKGVWRVGGNACIIRTGSGYEAMRWHDAIRAHAHLKYKLS